MNNIRNIFYYKNYYLDFFNALDYEVKQKLNWTLKLISQVDRVPVKYFKHMVMDNPFLQRRRTTSSYTFNVVFLSDKFHYYVSKMETQNTRFAERNFMTKVKK